VIILSKKRNIQ